MNPIHTLILFLNNQSNINLCNLIGLLCFLNVPHMLFAQSTYLPFNNPAYHFTDRIEIQSNTLHHTLFTNQKPYSRKQVANLHSNLDTLSLKFRAKDRYNHRYVYIDNNEWTDKGHIPTKKPLLKYFYQYRSDFFLKEGDDFVLKINPVLNVGLGIEANSAKTNYQNTRGFEVRGRLFDKVGFYSILTENQIVTPTYVQNRVFKKYGGDEAVPGEGAWTAFGENEALDFFTYRGYLSFPVFKKIKVQFGHDHHFLGNGYRSMLLSNFGAPYLFAKVQTQFWRLSYQTIWSELVQQYSILDGAQLRNKKFAATHHLSINATPWLNIGLFESVIFFREGGFDLNYLNPVIFYKAIEWHQGSPDNSVIGIDWKAVFLKHFSVYGQFLLDDFRASELFIERRGWFANKYAFQSGIKYIDAFNITQLDIQLEYNMARPYTYSHFDTTINYTHYNQPLAHPLGSNFQEFLGIVRYRPHPKIALTNQLMYAEKGENTDSLNFGGDIFADQTTYFQEFGNELLQGSKKAILHNQFILSYMPWHNIFVDFTYQFRSEKYYLLPEKTLLTHYAGIHFRMNIAAKDFFF